MHPSGSLERPAKAKTDSDAASGMPIPALRSPATAPRLSNPAPDREAPFPTPNFAAKFSVVLGDPAPY